MAKNQKSSIKRSGHVNYPVGDFLIRVKNAALVKKRPVSVNKTKFVLEIAKVMEKQGILRNITQSDHKINMEIAYRKKESVLIDLNLVSKPGLRVYMGVDDLAKIKSPTYFLISTPRGIMTSTEAKSKNLGGEVIVEILQ